MASHKMTFTIPEDLARQFLKTVPARRRSSYVSEAIEAKLRERESRLRRACDAANRDLDVAAIEGEWESIRDSIAEPWTDAKAR